MLMISVMFDPHLHILCTSWMVRSDWSGSFMNILMKGRLDIALMWLMCWVVFMKITICHVFLTLSDTLNIFS